uniref:Uncharacterized protein n=1 Tax=Arundo donax TaxID=35708 RepID=A0A0A9AKT9_ARUDO
MQHHRPAIGYPKFQNWVSHLGRREAP